MNRELVNVTVCGSLRSFGVSPATIYLEPVHWAPTIPRRIYRRCVFGTLIVESSRLEGIEPVQFHKCVRYGSRTIEVVDPSHELSQTVTGRRRHLEAGRRYPAAP